MLYCEKLVKVVEASKGTTVGFEVIVVVLELVIVDGFRSLVEVLAVSNDCDFVTDSNIVDAYACSASQRTR